MIGHQQNAEYFQNSGQNVENVAVVREKVPHWEPLCLKSTFEINDRKRGDTGPVPSRSEMNEVVALLNNINALDLCRPTGFALLAYGS